MYFIRRLVYVKCSVASCEETFGNRTVMGGGDMYIVLSWINNSTGKHRARYTGIACMGLAKYDVRGCKVPTYYSRITLWVLYHFNTCKTSGNSSSRHRKWTTKLTSCWVHGAGPHHLLIRTIRPYITRPCPCASYFTIIKQRRWWKRNRHLIRWTELKWSERASNLTKLWVNIY